MNLAMRGGLCTMCGQLPSNFVLKWSGGMWSACVHGPLAGYVKLRVAHAPGMPVTFTLPPWVSDPDIHHATCAPHEPRCRSGSLTSGFLWSRWRGKRSGIPGACATHNFTYLVRGPLAEHWQGWQALSNHVWCTLCHIHVIRDMSTAPCKSSQWQTLLPVDREI